MKLQRMHGSELTVKMVTICIAKIVRHQNVEGQNEECSRLISPKTMGETEVPYEEYPRLISPKTMEEKEVPQKKRSYYRVMGLN